MHVLQALAKVLIDQYYCQANALTLNACLLFVLRH